MLTLYAWHNGTSGHNLLETFVNYHFFLPLEETLWEYILLQLPTRKAERQRRETLEANQRDYTLKK